jgi:hypothetical protein
MSDHSQYEELAALAAGGHLDDDELSDFQRHWETCTQCRNAVALFGELVYFGVPLVQGRYRPDIRMITSRANPGATERFINRAAEEGIEFSRDVRKRDSSSGSLLSLALGAVAPAALLVGTVYDSHLRSHTPTNMITRMECRRNGSLSSLHGKIVSLTPQFPGWSAKAK